MRCEDWLDCSSRVVAGYAVGAWHTRWDARRSLRLARPRPRARKTSKACRARTVDESLDAAVDRSLSRSGGRHLAPAPSLVGRLRRLALIGGHELDFLLIVNPDAQARARIRRVLRSALRPATRLVELRSLSELGSLLESSSPEEGALAESLRLEESARAVIAQSPDVVEITEARNLPGGPDYLLEAGKRRIVVEVKRIVGAEQTRRLREARSQVEHWIDGFRADAGVIVVPDSASIPDALSDRIRVTTPKRLQKTLSDLAHA